MLENKKILIGVTASIAAYKIPFLIRLLIKEKAEVRVIMTPSAKHFVTPLTISTLSKHPIYCEPFNTENGQWNSHVELGNWADLFLIAPASANTLAKMANGVADNLLLDTYLAAKCPVFIAPAMDLDMFHHPSTQSNIKTLISYGNNIIHPQEGELASGLCGAGRMEEPETIVQILKNTFQKKKRFLNKTVLVTAGPTYEAIDPVRFIGNHSSGLMGYTVAEVMAEQGAQVVLISGPSYLQPKHSAIKKISVVSAEEMYNVCLEYFEKADITIMTAAVADFTPKKTEFVKIKKEKKDDTLCIELKATKDILAHLGSIKRNNQILVGFALETDQEFENAMSKLQRKNLDFIVLNSLKDQGAGFGTPTNKISILSQNKTKAFELKSKVDVAHDIIDEIFDIWQIKHPKKK